MRIGSFHFTPAVVPTLAFLLVFPVLIALGFWQLDRAEQKREIERQVHRAISREPLKLNLANLADLPNQVYRSAVLQGHYDSGRQYLWDNKTSQGKPGYQVLTPFLLQGSDSVVMVNRGWIPILGRRDEYPAIAVDSGQLEIRGVIKQPSNAIQLSQGDSLKSQGYPHLIQAFEPEVIGVELKQPIAPVLIELDAAVPFGFVREWQPYYGKITKHIAYAVQWFLMALIVLFLYLKLNLKRQSDSLSV